MNGNPWDDNEKTGVVLSTQELIAALGDMRLGLEGFCDAPNDWRRRNEAIKKFMRGGVALAAAMLDERFEAYGEGPDSDDEIRLKP